MQRSWLISSQRVDFNCIDPTVVIEIYLPKLILLTNLAHYLNIVPILVNCSITGRQNEHRAFTHFTDESTSRLDTQLVKQRPCSRVLAP